MTGSAGWGAGTSVRSLEKPQAEEPDRRNKMEGDVA